MSERRYGNYVSGRCEADLATLVRIAAVLASTPTDLLTTTTNKSTAEELIRRRVIAALAALSLDDLERAAIMIEALAARRA
ncbi:XRE family transcriptional regulator [Brucella sp. 2716]|uniref:XRE family transcriptional regulator n=1 Tax=Brucella sp. 2716 TaxID=2975052 RepID=UPI0038F69F00